MNSVIDWIMQMVAALLLLAAAIIHTVNAWRYRKIRKELKKERRRHDSVYE
jgi:hypothetical protein